MLNTNQKNLIIDRINDKIDLPLLGERAERALIDVVVNQIDKELDVILPEQYKGFVDNAAVGLSGTEDAMAFIRQNLAAHLTQKLNFGMLGQEKGKQVVELFVDIFVNALQKGNSL